MQRRKHFISDEQFEKNINYQKEMKKINETGKILSASINSPLPKVQEKYQIAAKKRADEKREQKRQRNLRLLTTGGLLPHIK